MAQDITEVLVPSSSSVVAAQRLAGTFSTAVRAATRSESHAYIDDMSGTTHRISEDAETHIARKKKDAVEGDGYAPEAVVAARSARSIRGVEMIADSNVTRD